MTIPTLMDLSQSFTTLSLYCVLSLFHHLFGFQLGSHSTVTGLFSPFVFVNTHKWKTNGAAGLQCDCNSKLVCARVCVCVLAADCS